MTFEMERTRPLAAVAALAVLAAVLAAGCGALQTRHVAFETVALGLATVPQSAGGTNPATPPSQPAAPKAATETPSPPTFPVFQVSTRGEGTSVTDEAGARHECFHVHFDIVNPLPKPVTFDPVQAYIVDDEKQKVTEGEGYCGGKPTGKISVAPGGHEMFAYSFGLPENVRLKDVAWFRLYWSYAYDGQTYSGIAKFIEAGRMRYLPEAPPPSEETREHYHSLIIGVPPYYGNHYGYGNYYGYGYGPGLRDFDRGRDFGRGRFLRR